MKPLLRTTHSRHVSVFFCINCAAPLNMNTVQSVWAAGAPYVCLCGRRLTAPSKHARLSGDEGG